MWMYWMRIAINVICIITPQIPSFAHIQTSEPGPLPADIIFAASEGEAVDRLWWLESKHNILGRIDATTLEITSFYIDETATALIPLSWSPGADKLAVAQITETDDAKGEIALCIVSATGTLQTCLEDNLAVSPYYAYGLGDEYTVTWSTDGQTIYYVAVDPTSTQKTHRLVEANVTTGATLRTLYQVESVLSSYSYYSSPRISWSPDLLHVAVGVANYERAERLGPTKLVNLETGEELSLESINGENVEVVCRDFSPLGTYLVAIIYEDVYMDRLIVLDKHGTIVRAIDVGAYGSTNPECPTWSADENFFYLTMFTDNIDLIDTTYGFSHILLYSFGEDRLVEYLAVDDLGFFPPMTLSDDYLALSSQPFPGGPGVTEGRQITVIYPNREMIHLGAPFHQATHPIWTPTQNK